MRARLLLRACLAGFLVLIALRAGAGEAEDRAALNAALGIEPLLGIMQQEGRSFGTGLGGDFLPGGGGSGWQGIVARIYDRDRMRRVVENGLAGALDARHLPALLDFFRSERGQRIVAQEIEARRAFLDPEAEAAARAAFLDAGEPEAARLALIRAYVAANDLIGFNVAGALNANLRFYQGMVEGGALEMSEAEMVDEVWGQEEETRADTEEWMMAYLMLAYSTLSDGDIAAYVALSETPEGRALNQALFAGFDRMYSDISYALGLAVAQQMKGEDL